MTLNEIDEKIKEFEDEIKKLKDEKYKLSSVDIFDSLEEGHYYMARIGFGDILYFKFDKENVAINHDCSCVMIRECLKTTLARAWMVQSWCYNEHISCEQFQGDSIEEISKEEFNSEVDELVGRLKKLKND